MKFTIITISYNQGRYLEKAINSVINQKWNDLEYIVLDGGSTDGSAEIIKKHANFFSYWRSEPDGGPADALKEGFERATGDIIGFLNADDFYLSNAFYNVASAFNRFPFVDVVYGNGVQVDSQGRIVKKIYSDRWQLRRAVCHACSLVQQSTFIKRSAYKKTTGFNVENKTCWDGELWIDLSLSGAIFKRINKYLSAFRIHEQSISGSGRLNDIYLEDRLRIYNRVKQKSKGQIPMKEHLLCLIEKRITDPFTTFLRVLEKIKSHDKRF